MATKPVTIFNSTTSSLETPHTGDIVSIPTPVNVTGDITVTGNVISNGSVLGAIDSGTASSVAALSITDNSKSWATNSLANTVAAYLSGGAVATSLVASNTTIQLTLYAGASNPDPSTTFSVYGVGANTLALVLTTGSTADVATVGDMIISSGSIELLHTRTATNSIDIYNVPAGNITSTLVQDAVNELDTKKIPTTDREGINGVAGLDANSEVIKPQAGAAAEVTAGRAKSVKKADGTWGTTAYRGAVATLTALSIAPLIEVAISFNSTYTDTDSIHSNTTNNTRMTVPTGVSRVRLSCSIYLDSGGFTGGVAYLYAKKNGFSDFGCYDSFQIVNTVSQALSFTSRVFNVVSGDYFELYILQSNANTLSLLAGTTDPVAFGVGIPTYFEMEIIE